MAAAPRAKHLTGSPKRAMGDFAHTWSGEASAWECDELGHLNMRRYMYKCAQARQMLCIMLGLTGSFKKGAYSTVDVREFHIKYLGEVRPGGPISIKSAITDLRKTDMDIVHIMSHPDGRPACTVSERLSHVSRRTYAAFPWPSRLHNAAADFTIAFPDIAKSKGIDLSQAPSAMSEDAAKTAGMRLIGRGVFQPGEADIFGRITAQALLGRVTETVGQFSSAWPEMFSDDFTSGKSHIHGALLEARVILGVQAEPGDAYNFYSGVAGANPNVRTLVHKIYNAVTGAQIASKQGVGCLMDLNSRRHVKTPIETVEALNAAAVPGLKI